MGSLPPRKWSQVLKPVRLVPQEKHKSYDGGYSSRGPQFLRVRQHLTNKCDSSCPHKSRTVPTGCCSNQNQNCKWIQRTQISEANFSLWWPLTNVWRKSTNKVKKNKNKNLPYICLPLHFSLWPLLQKACRATRISHVIQPIRSEAANATPTSTQCDRTLKNGLPLVMGD